MSGHDLDLPLEIFSQILTKLPVRSVLRFRCVCKTWYSLVSCPDFISDHTAQTLNRSSGDRALVHRHHTLNSPSNFTIHDEPFKESHEHPDVPETLRSRSVKIVGSCDGLICFSKLDSSSGVGLRSFLIWNPSIRKLVEIPPPPSPFPPRYLLGYLAGFGFDSESRDYKVVAQTHIFDLRKGVWRSSSSLMSRSCVVRQPAFYLHGNLHYPGTHHDSSNYILVSLDLSSEVLHETEMMLDGDILGPEPRLLLINGLLSVAKVKEGQNYCSVWSMKEYGVTESWTKLFTIELPYTSYTTKKLVPLRSWENGEVLFVQWRWTANYVLFWYDPESKKSATLLSSNTGHIVDLDACFYKESLVLL